MVKKGINTDQWNKSHLKGQGISKYIYLKQTIMYNIKMLKIQWSFLQWRK